jgi:hypothetical protein
LRILIGVGRNRPPKKKKRGGGYEVISFLRSGCCSLEGLKLSCPALLLMRKKKSIVVLKKKKNIGMNYEVFKLQVVLIFGYQNLDLDLD